MHCTMGQAKCKMGNMKMSTSPPILRGNVTFTFLFIEFCWNSFRKIGKNSKNSYFFILEVQFHHEGGLSKGRSFELFYSAGSLCPPYEISSFTEAPFYLFGTFSEILTNFFLLNNFWFFSVQNLGHIRNNCTVFLVVGVKMSKKLMSALALFFLCSKTQRGHLNL